MNPPSSPFPSASFVSSRRSGRTHRRPPLGYACYGGGNHALITAFGSFRGLAAHQLPGGGSPVEALGLLSSNSGGSWFNFPFMFAGFNADAPKGQQHTPIATLLNVRTEGGRPSARPFPAEINAADLEQLSSDVLAYTLTLDPSWFQLCPLLLSLFTSAILPFHRLWLSYIYNCYFKPLGIPKGKYFTESEEEAKAIVATNPHLQLSDFIWPRNGPIPVAVATMIAPSDSLDASTRRILAAGRYLWDQNLGGEPGFIRPDVHGSILVPVLEAREAGGGVTCVPQTFSPLLAGTRYESQRHGEPYVMDAGGSCVGKPLLLPIREVPPHKFVKRSLCLSCTTSERLSVEVVAAASSAAYEMFGGFAWAKCKPADFEVERSLRSLAIQLKAGVTPIHQREQGVTTQEERSLSFGDGALIDNTAIIAHLQHRTRHIIFANTPYKPYSQIYAKVHDGSHTSEEARLNAWLTADPFGQAFYALFGYIADSPVMIENASRMISVVFADGRARLTELMTNLDRLYEAGKPMVYTLKDLHVIENPFWGVEPHVCDLTIINYYLIPAFGRAVGAADNPVVYNETTGRFDKPYDNVPELQIAGENFKPGSFFKRGPCGVPELNLTAYTTGQINLTSYLATWTINEAWEPIVLDRDTVFEGFAAIFSRGIHEEL